MKGPKKTIQEYILSLLARSRATRQDELVTEIEAILSERENKKRKIKPVYLIRRAINNMIRDDVITHHQAHHSSFLSLSSKGRQKLRSIKLSSKSHLISTRWDGFWRIVIVDIAESRKKDQDALRYVLKKAQFVQIKNSIWISPYPLEHMMINMKKDMGLDHDVIVLVTDKLDVSTEQTLIQKFSEKDSA